MPNYFCFIGPNSPISNGSLVLGIQATSICVYKWMDKLQTEMIKSFEVRGDVVREYNQHVQKSLERTVWTRGCRSWYKRGTIDGPSWPSITAPRSTPWKPSRALAGRTLIWRERKRPS